MAAIYLLGIATGLAISFLPDDSLRGALKFVMTFIFCKECGYVGTDKAEHEAKHALWRGAAKPGPIPLNEEKLSKPRVEA